VSLEKAIQSGKEHRRPYHGSKRFDTTCRPHGGCPYCEGNRLHQRRKKELFAMDDMAELEDQDTYLKVVEGRKGLDAYIALGGWDSRKQWEEDFGLSVDDPSIGEVFPTEEFEGALHIVDSTIQKVGYNVGTHWYVDSVNVYILNDGTKIILNVFN
jgi:hypothetical protein